MALTPFFGAASAVSSARLRAGFKWYGRVHLVCFVLDTSVSYRGGLLAGFGWWEAGVACRMVASAAGPRAAWGVSTLRWSGSSETDRAALVAHFGVWRNDGCRFEPSESRLRLAGRWLEPRSRDNVRRCFGASVRRCSVRLSQLRPRVERRLSGRREARGPGFGPLLVGGMGPGGALVTSVIRAFHESDKNGMRVRSCSDAVAAIDEGYSSKGAASRGSRFSDLPVLRQRLDRISRETWRTPAGSGSQDLRPGPRSKPSRW
jgi:hypothetical protein